MIPHHLAIRLDPAFIAWLQATHVELPDGFTPTPEQLREGYRQTLSTVNRPADPSLEIQDKSVTSRDGNSITVRHYAHKSNTQPEAVCVFLHGGGWILGDLETHHSVCSDLAVESGCAVIAVDYRLSPENRYPAALNDCEDVLMHLYQHAHTYNIDAERMAVFGDSAGGSLAAAACLRLRDARRQGKAVPTLKAQLLVYPALADSMDAPSYKENAEVPGLSIDDMLFYFTAYVGDTSLPDPLAAPLTVDDLGDLPQSLVVVAQFDPLRDDGVMYAQKLKTAGVKTTLNIVPKVGHSFLWIRHSSSVVSSAFSSIAQHLKTQLST